MTQPADFRRGDVFGLLTVVGDAGTDDRGAKLWRCRCVCGNEVERITQMLRKGRSYSCGCQRRPYGWRRGLVGADAPRFSGDEAGLVE